MKTGDKIGYLLLQNRFIKNKRAYWNCLCELCNSEKDIREDCLKTGKTVSCGCCKKTKMFSDKTKANKQIEDLTGKQFGSLLVVCLSEKRIGKKILWTCRCSCGNIIDVWSANIKNGNSKTCGSYIHREKHLQEMWEKTFEDLTGKTFGDWKVIQRDGSGQPTKWICECRNCGNIKSVIGNSLKSGESLSCGCRRHNESLVGKTIGYWNVIKRSSRKRPNGHYCTTYYCECKCGTKRYVDESRLLNGTSSSCGCVNSKGNEYISNALTKMNIKFKTEHSFQDLTGPHGGVLRFDFVILNEHNNIICLIEYQGIQHYTETDFGKDQREITDIQKRKYCSNNNIQLFEIKYNDNIQEKIKEILSRITC